jgi:hypothetical protein
MQNNNKVYVLWHNSLNSEQEETELLGIFKSKKGAEDYRDEQILEMYGDEIQASDRLEYFIESFYLGE